MSKPFLSIVTRCSQRPHALLRCIHSVARQSDLDIEQVFLVDHEHRGLRYANEQFHRYRNAPSGEYVWALDDDNVASDRDFVASLKAIASETAADVIVVKMTQEHKDETYPKPDIWEIDWKGGERPEEWAGGGACVAVRKEVWAEHTEAYFDGQGEDWHTGGDWRFIMSLIEDKALTFAKCDVIAARQLARGYGKKAEDCEDDWFELIREKLNLEHIGRDAWRFDHREAKLKWGDIPVFLSEKPLKILQLAQWDWAACSYMLSEAIKYHTPHFVKAVRWREKDRFQFPNSIISPTRNELRRLWDWADIVHIHDSAPIPSNFPFKPTVITMHGSKYRNSPAKYRRLARQRGWLLTVATPDLTGLHGAPWMPDTRINLPEASSTLEGFWAIHCPTIRVNKGTKSVIAQMAKIPEINFKLIEDMPWEDCIAIKASITRGVLIDQMTYGYGCNAIEAWAFGLPVISHAIGPSRKAIKNLFGYYPFVNTAPDEIAEKVLQLSKDSRFYRQCRDAGIAHYRRYHAPEAAAACALDLYEAACELKPIGAKAGDLPEPTDVDTLSLIRYLGGNTGRTTWVGPSTGVKYHFSGAQRLRYVDTRDVRGFLAIKHHGNRLFAEVNE